MAHNKKQEQDQNTGKLVMNAFYKVARNRSGVSALDITRYLENKFGEVWRRSTLMSKAEDVLRRSAILGFLYRHGDRYTTTRYCQKRRRRPVRSAVQRRCNRYSRRKPKLEMRVSKPRKHARPRSPYFHK